MRRSQLELYVIILMVLAHRSPMKLTHVMHKVNINYSRLKKSLVFLTKQGLVEEKIIEKERKVYAITQLGVTVIKQFRDLEEVFPIFEETGNKTRNRVPYLF